MQIMKIELHGLTFRIFVKIQIYKSTRQHKITIVQIDRVESQFGDVFLKHATDIIAKNSIEIHLQDNLTEVLKLYKDDIELIDNEGQVHDLLHDIDE